MTAILGPAEFPLAKLLDCWRLYLEQIGFFFVLFMQPADKTGHGGVLTVAPLQQSFVSHINR